MSDNSVKSSGNVVSLCGGPACERVANETCIQALQDALEKAKSGEIIGVAIAGLYFDGRCDCGLSGFIGGYSLLGAITVLQADLVAINRGED